jgi:hypothetical protein
MMRPPHCQRGAPASPTSGRGHGQECCAFEYGRCSTAPAGGGRARSEAQVLPVSHRSVESTGSSPPTPPRRRPLKRSLTCTPTLGVGCDYTRRAGQVVITIGLSHEETNSLLATMVTAAGSAGSAVPKVAAALTALGITATAVPYIAAAIVLHLTWETALIKASDWGNGVFLFANAPMLIGMPGVVIPYARTGLKTDWPGMDGEVKSERNDVIAYHVTPHGGRGGAVSWLLTNESSSGWTKGVIIQCHGEDHPIYCDAGVTNDEYTGVADAQNASIVFKKPGWLGRWEDVLTIHGKPELADGDLVQFTWKQD